MSIRDFFHGSGRIVFKEQFVSLRLITEALERKFSIRIIEDSSNGFRCKVIRYARLYAAPMPFSNPALEVSFQNDKHEAVINYRITSYDYYLVIILALISGILSARIGITDGMIGAVRQGFLFSIFALLFFGILVLIDARFFAHRIRKALLNLK